MAKGLGWSSEFEPIHQISFDNDGSQDLLSLSSTQWSFVSLSYGHAFPLWSIIDCCVSAIIVGMGIDGTHYGWKLSFWIVVPGGHAQIRVTGTSQLLQNPDLQQTILCIPTGLNISEYIA